MGCVDEMMSEEFQLKASDTDKGNKIEVFKGK